jgi:hypothetical protein
LALPPGSTFGTFTFGTFSSDTSGSGTSGSGTSGSGTSGAGTFGFTTFGTDTFDSSTFGTGFGGPGSFDPGGGLGSGFDFGSTFTTASNNAPADSGTPTTLVADGSFGIGFDQKTDQNADKSVDDATSAVPEKAIAVAEKDGASPDPVPAAHRFALADTAPVAGKVGLSAQLRAAGRHGFLHDRLALLKSLRDGVIG